MWHKFIAGARGIVYFTHSFRGPCGGDHNVLRTNCEGTRPAVLALNQQIKSLAPVLNSQFADGYAAGPSSVRVMSKRTGSGEFYVFAASAQRAGQQVAISVKSGTTATVVGESRTVPIVNGNISDSFADNNAVHIYKIQ